MARILLMDDVITEYGTMVSGCQNCLAKHGIDCTADNARMEPYGELPHTRGKAGQYLLELFQRLEPDGLVIDIDWGEIIPYDGFDILESARELGLSIDNRMVIFMTQHLPLAELPEMAMVRGFKAEQVLYKNAQGCDAATRWFCKEFGIQFRGCR